MNYNPYAIIALSFGTGKSNKYLAEIVEGISKQFPKAKLILQKEIADYLPTKEEIDKKIENLHIFSRGIMYGRDAGRMSSDIDKEIRELEAKREKIKEIGEKIVISEHRQEGKYLDTFEVFGQVAQLCFPESYLDILIVAHPDHFPRVKLVAEEYEFKVGMGVVPYLGKDSIPYDNSKNNTQWWTRGRIRFLIWSGLAYLWLIINPGRKK